MIIFLFILTGKSDAAIITSQFITDKVTESVINQISANIPGKISVEIKRMPYKSIKVPDGQVTVKTIVNTNFFTTMTVVKVNILVNGQEVETFGVPVKISVHDDVWVATDIINKGDSLTNSNLELVRKDISLMAEHAARKNTNFDNAIVRKMFRSGDVIDTRFIETAPTVRKNSYVSIIFQSPNITITADGESMEDGKVGDFVKVRNKKYKTLYTGKVISANTILVNI